MSSSSSTEKPPWGVLIKFVFYCIVVSDNMDTSRQKIFFFLRPQPLWTFQASFILYISLNYLILQNPPPPGNSNLSYCLFWFAYSTKFGCCIVTWLNLLTFFIVLENLINNHYMSILYFNVIYILPSLTFRYSGLLS